MRTFVLALLIGVLGPSTVTAQPPAAMPRPATLVLEDQFNRKADLATLRGSVVIIVYGDRKSTEMCRSLGESLHVCWHPEAKGLPPAKAQAAPVVPLENLRPGQESPNVVVVPVATCGKVPGPVRGLIRGQIAKAAPDAVVWLDFAETMKETFGQTTGEPNIVIFDAEGRQRLKVLGKTDSRAMDELVKQVQGLRYEAVK